MGEMLSAKVAGLQEGSVVGRRSLRIRSSGYGTWAELHGGFYQNLLSTAIFTTFHVPVMGL